jgi:hypothetical protein
MRVEHAEVVAVLRSPEAEYQGARRYGPGRRVLLGGRLAVVVADPGPAIVTVLWRGREARHEEATA